MEALIAPSHTKLCYGPLLGKAYNRYLIATGRVKNGVEVTMEGKTLSSLLPTLSCSSLENSAGNWI